MFYLYFPFIIFLAAATMILAKLLRAVFAFYIGMPALHEAVLSGFGQSDDQKRSATLQWLQSSAAAFDTVPSSTLFIYALAVGLLLSVLCALTLSSRHYIVKRLIPIPGASPLYVSLKSAIPAGEWDESIAFYHDPQEDDMRGFRDLLTKKIILGTGPVTLLTSRPNDLLFFYLHEIAHIKSRDSLLLNAFDSWRVLVYAVVVAAYLPEIVWVAASALGGSVTIGIVGMALKCGIGGILLVYFYDKWLRMWRHAREYRADRYAFQKSGLSPFQAAAFIDHADERLVARDVDADERPDGYHPPNTTRASAMIRGHYRLDACPVLFFVIVLFESLGPLSPMTWWIVGACLALCFAEVLFRGRWQLDGREVALIIAYLSVACVVPVLLLRDARVLFSPGEPWLGIDRPVVDISLWFLMYGILAMACVALCSFATRRNGGKYA